MPVMMTDEDGDDGGGGGGGGGSRNQKTNEPQHYTMEIYMPSDYIKFRKR